VRKPILPGATLGILGGGQLGRMTAMAARSLGYHVHALDPDPLHDFEGLPYRRALGQILDRLTAGAASTAA